MRRLRVMQMLAPLTLAGAERVVLNMLRHLDALRFEQFVCLQLNAKRPDPSVLAEVRRLGSEPDIVYLRRTFEWRQVREVAAALRTRRIDVLHTHGYRTDVTGYLAARLAHVPIVATVHGWIANSPKAHLYHYLQKQALRRFDHVIAVSDAIAAELIRCGVPRPRLCKITNAVQLPDAPPEGNGLLRRELGLPPQAKLVGTLGRLSREKGLAYFLEAAAMLQADFPEALFVVVGEGRERPALERQAERLGLGGRVRFYGYRRDIEHVYPALDLYVLPSLTEGLPMSLLEAISYGVPFVATAVGEIPVLLGEAAGGGLVAPGNAAALARAMGAALSDPEAARQKAARIRGELEEHWSLEHWRTSIEDIYLRLAGKANSSMTAHA